MHFNFACGSMLKPVAALSALAVALSLNTASIAQETSASDASKNWNIVCVAAGRKDVLSCTMEQQIIVRETGRRLARLTIKTTNAAEGFGSLLVQVPLGLSIVDNLSLQVDQAEVITIPIQTCDASGCYGGYAVDEQLLAALRAGNQLVLSFFDLQKQKISANFTLAGFTAAYAKIK